MTASRQLAEFATACREGCPAVCPRCAGAGARCDGADACGARGSGGGGGDPRGGALGRNGRGDRIWSPERIPAPSAALVNGTLAHALDYDDTHLPSVLHPSASVVPGRARRGRGDRGHRGAG